MRDDNEVMTVTWERLNAYVDHELDPSDAAGVAAAIARDPALAARVATLAALRATTTRLTLPGDASKLRLPRRRPAKVVRSAAIAASLVVAVAIGAAVWWQASPKAPAPQLASAITAHRQWLSGGLSPASAGGIEIATMAGSSRTLPDLSAAALKLVYLSADPARRDGGVLAGYVGPHGCRLGLWIAPQAGRARPQPEARDRDDLLIRMWGSNDADYALLGRGIDALRLDRIAMVVARMTQNDPAAAREQVAALSEIRSVGPACTG